MHRREILKAAGVAAVGGAALLIAVVCAGGLAIWYVQGNQPAPVFAPGPDPDDERFGGRDDWD